MVEVKVNITENVNCMHHSPVICCSGADWRHCFTRTYLTAHTRTLSPQPVFIIWPFYSLNINISDIFHLGFFKLVLRMETDWSKDLDDIAYANSLDHDETPHLASHPGPNSLTNDQ